MNKNNNLRKNYKNKKNVKTKKSITKEHNYENKNYERDGHFK